MGSKLDLTSILGAKIAPDNRYIAIQTSSAELVQKLLFQHSPFNPLLTGGGLLAAPLFPGHQVQC